MFLRNVACHSEEYTALYPSRNFHKHVVRTSNRVEVILFETHIHVTQRRLTCNTAGYTYKHAHTSIYTYNLYSQAYIVYTNMHITYIYTEAYM
jgi:hypothetical protein